MVLFMCLVRLMFAAPIHYDAEGKPFIKFKAGFGLGFMRELEDHRKWIEAFHAGELTPIEEMELPAFQFEQAPYFIFDTPAQA